MPDLGEEEPWLLVEASDDGRFFLLEIILKDDVPKWWRSM
jgi:hypothetical protein